MQTIKEGHLYFLESPFHFRPPTEESTDTEKRLSYLLGTVSARPAVVIRAPSFWDRFNTVTVIPALSKGKPAITYRLKDRYGNYTSAVYPFVPHNPHTIPVARLGKFIGTLDDDELSKLIYAFKWIHDPYAQAHPEEYPVPECYLDVMKLDVPESWRHNRDARANVDLTIDKNTLKIHSRNYPKLDGFPLGNAITGDVPDEVIDDADYVQTTNALPDEIEDEPEEDGAVYGFIRDEEPKTEEASEPEDDESTLPFTMTEPAPKEEEHYGLVSDDDTEDVPDTSMNVPVEKDFPPSSFPVDMLREVAGRFDFSAAYYNNDLPTRDPRHLTEDEIRSIRGPSTNSELDEICDYYRALTPMDAYVLGPRLPTDALQRITGFNRQKTAILKRLCNVMRDIPDEDYASRVAAYELVQAQLAAEKAAKKEQAKEEKANLKAQQAEDLAIVRKYLSADDVLEMSTEAEARAFLRLPMGVVKRAWNGINFKEHYSEAKSFYKKGLKLYDELRDKVKETNREIPEFGEYLDRIADGIEDLVRE